ncbi:MAG: type II toxin-antitoxin system VapC family toxin [Verrucomicrobia bacterium]|nr:type II toxin-antitoxin system VapC family toxin [Verrucomicrobiota bacterium]MCC5850781.1 type II toxin-antitoxin system VapC family toxin [Verrucomicrobiota bacterium]MCH8528931.1 type II toxin-antitoxin system VapC family toxin [Kiritimatiellia bacterium]
MKVLLDTHIFLWAVSEPEKLPVSYRSILDSLANECLVSSVSISEIMIKCSIGKLDCPFNPVEEVKEAGFELIPFNGEDALPLKDLPFHHRDPFDRMLIAQSMTRGLQIMTCNAKFSAYNCSVLEIS